MRNVLFVASESAPFIKTGGLGSVLGSLPKELNKLNSNVSVVIPAYECIDQTYQDQMEYILSYPVQLGWRKAFVDLYKLEINNLCYYFIKNDFYFSGKEPYGEIWLDIEKFAFFSKAVLEMLTYLEIPVDVIHCHDWQTGLVPVFLKLLYNKDPYFKRIKTIMTIHNIKFQGVTDINRMKDITGLPDHAFTMHILENFGDANMLKGGIACSDYVSTVSASYAREIMTPEYGEGLHALLYYRKDSLYGIVNGIDWDLYNPEKDPYISSHYNQNDFREKRLPNKKALQELTGLPVKEDALTMGIVSRLTEQKGYDLLNGGLDRAFQKGAQLYVLGSGQEEVEAIFQQYAEKYPNQVYINGGYKDEIAKAIYAGCDITLMPSLFEPCGLNQLMAMRYGCLPVVRATGGLKDTVMDDRELTGNGSGFSFTEYNMYAFRACMERVMKLYNKHRDLWEERMERGMGEDFSWKTSAFEYEKLYEALSK